MGRLPTTRSALLRLVVDGSSGRGSVRPCDGKPVRVPDFFIRTVGAELICRECRHAASYADSEMPPSGSLVDCPGCKLPSRVPGVLT